MPNRAPRTSRTSRPATSKKTVKTSQSAPIKKLFVLDTNVLLHDPGSLFKFAEHDLFIPFVTIEELDNKKSGTQDVNRNARQATRLLDAVISQTEGSMNDGYPLKSFNSGHALGRLYVQKEGLPFLEHEFERKNDNLYLAVLRMLVQAKSHDEVVMVTKDLNLRIKARAMGFSAQDYLHDHAVEDADLIHRGIREVPADWLSTLHVVESSKPVHSLRTLHRVQGLEAVHNEFFYDGSNLYRMVGRERDIVTLSTVPDYRKPKHALMGICARNEEQAAALELLTDPNVDLVALLGPAGTGKTLLAVAAGLYQVAEHESFDELLFTRATISLGEDIGFLPGGEEEKLSPWLGALYDNLEVIIQHEAKSPNEQMRLREMVKERVQIRAITFMRGRSFQQKYLVIDEAQNLTPKQVKALVTRAGDGTKIVLMGNLAQIDSPYLSETSSGLAYAVERFKDWEHFGSLILSKGERSRLASAGNDRL